MIPITEENVRSALTYLSPDVEHKQWFEIGAAVKDALNEEGFKLFDKWSQGGASYDKNAVGATWRAINPNGGVTVGTLFGLAGQNGWKPEDDGYEETEEDRQKRAEERKAAEAKAEKERLKKARNAAKKTEALLSVAKPANADHPYLVRKGIKALGLTEILANDAEKLLGYAPKSSSELLTGRLLIAPVYVGGKLSMAELIDENGKKTAIAGGIKKAGYWKCQSFKEEDSEDLVIAIAEGVATTLSIIESTDYLTIAALSASNIPNVAKALRKHYQKAQIIICSDVGNGQKYAEQAAEQNKAMLVLPEFTTEQVEQFKAKNGKEPTDFNDLHLIAGLNSVSQQLAINKQLEQEPVSVKMLADNITNAFKQQLNQRLIADYNLIESGKYLRGQCPDCHQKTLWTWKDDAASLRCECGVKLNTNELYPEIFENLNASYPVVESDHKRTANAYMIINRGLPLVDIYDWYDQGTYWHSKANKGTATVLFWLNQEKNIAFEQLVEPVIITEEDGSQTSIAVNYKGANAGLYWQPPTQEIKKGDKVYLCDGVFNAIALAVKGHKVIGLLNAKALPDTLLTAYGELAIRWVIALGNDSQSRTATHKHLLKLKKNNQHSSCIFSSDTHEKLEWSELYKSGKLEVKDLDTYRYYGKLETAHGSLEKAFTLWNHDNRNYFCFSYRKKTYAVKVDSKEFLKAKKDAEEIGTDEEWCKEQAFNQSAEINQIATFELDFLYFQQPQTGDTGQNFFKVSFSNNSPTINAPFPGCVLSAATDFKKAIRKISPSAIFTGSTLDLDYLSEQWQKQAPSVVSTIDYLGYDRLSKAYVFEDFAVEDGVIHKVNDQNFFKLKKHTIKTTHSLPPSIAHQLTTAKPVDWLDDYRTAYGTKGIVTLAWHFGTLFVQQIRAKHRSYPFFELFGEAGSGKSDMVDFLFKLIGLHNMGFNPSRGFTSAAGLTRKTSELANMPICFNETENDNHAKDKHVETFDWAKFLDFYEGRNGVAKGVSTNDNKTRMPEFKAALMAVQNPQITGSEAIITRFITVNFDRSHHRPEGRSASDRLKNLEIKAVSGFLLSSITKEKLILKQYETSFEKYRAQLSAMPDIKMQRISHNHAQLMAMIDCLKLVFPLTDADVTTSHAMLKTMAVVKQQQINQDNPIVQQFWANFEYLNTHAVDDGFGDYRIDDHLLNHSNATDVEIAVNLEHFNAKCYDRHLPMISISDLRKYLPTSKSKKFIESKLVFSRIEKKPLRCWIFKPR